MASTNAQFLLLGLPTVVPNYDVQTGNQSLQSYENTPSPHENYSASKLQLSPQPAMGMSGGGLTFLLVLGPVWPTNSPTRSLRCTSTTRSEGSRPTMCSRRANKRATVVLPEGDGGEGRRRKDVQHGRIDKHTRKKGEPALPSFHHLTLCNPSLYHPSSPALSCPHLSLGCPETPCEAVPFSPAP